MHTSILWLPAHPAEGSASMDRYWREIELVFKRRAAASFEIRCPLGAAPAQTHAAGRAGKIFKRYVAYPLAVRLAAGCEVAHILDHSSAHLLSGLPRRTYKIVTVHDLAPLEDASALSPSQLKRFRATVSKLHHADLLLCDSAYTARALKDFLQTERRIEVLFLGVNSMASSEALPLKLPVALPACPRVLSIGSTLERKNLRVLPGFFQALQAQTGQPVALVRVGARLPLELRAALEKFMPASHIVELGHLDDATLAALYQNVDLLLFPSTLEGFGLPVAEAMSAGCPVVSSNTSSLPEVGAEAALYFDPSNEKEAAAQALRLLRDPALRQAMIARGHARARELSWENHADRLISYYTRGTSPLPA